MSARLPALHAPTLSFVRDLTRAHSRPKLVWALDMRLVAFGLTWALVSLSHMYGGIFPGVRAIPAVLLFVLVSHLLASVLVRRATTSSIWLALAVGDSFLLSALLFYLGGTNSPILPLFFLQVFTTALFINGRLAVLIAALDVLLVVVLAVGEVMGLWQTWPVVPGPAPTDAMLQASLVARVLLWGAYLVVGSAVTAFVAMLVRRVEQEGLAQSQRELAALRTISQAAAGAEERPLAEVLATALAATQEALDVSLALAVAPETPEGRVWLYTPGRFEPTSARTRQTAVDHEAFPPFPELRAHLEALFGEEPLAVVRELDEAISALGIPPGLELWRGVRGDAKTQLYVLVPLRAAGSIHGVLLVASPRGTLQPGELQSLDLLAGEISRVLYQIHLREARDSLATALEHRNSQMQRIQDLNYELRLDLPIEDLAQRLVEGIREALGIDKVILSLLDEQGEPRTAAWSGQANQDPPPMTTSIDVGLLRPTNRVSRSYLLRAAGRENSVEPGQAWGQGDRLIVPIEVRGRTIGYLSLGTPGDGRVPARRMIEVIEIMASQAGLAIQNARLYQTIAQGRAHLNAILANSADPIIVFDQNHTVQLLNEAAEEALGVQARQVVGRPAREARFPGLKAVLKALRPAENQAWPEVVLADGRTFAMGAAPLVGPDDLKEAGWVVTLHDITRLKALDRLKSEFVSAVSHDLRAPLAAVAGYVYFLRKEVQSEGGVDALEHIEAATGRMSRLINDLLDLGRIESGAGFNREPLEVGPLLEAVREELQPLADAKHQQVVVQVAPETPPVEGDPDRLHQALVNLVHNAIKFTPVEGQIALRAEGVGRSLAIMVSDTGPGIPLEDQPHIFDSFYRAARRPGADGADAGGSGLGLAIVKGIVQQHGGRIALDSGPGKGTTFRITLPALYLPALALTVGK